MPKPIAKTQKKKLSGEFHQPLPWKAPFPASIMKGDPLEETVFVRAVVGQEIILNGKKYPTGEQTLPCGFAHQHAAVLSAPKE